MKTTLPHYWWAAYGINRQFLFAEGLMNQGHETHEGWIGEPSKIIKVLYCWDWLKFFGGFE
ncbi:MAG: hypothetical protein AAGJ83_04370 [Planctomycetota bacterium]